MVDRINAARAFAAWQVRQAMSYEVCCGGKWSRSIAVRLWLRYFLNFLVR